MGDFAPESDTFVAIDAVSIDVLLLKYLFAACYLL